MILNSSLLNLRTDNHRVCENTQMGCSQSCKRDGKGTDLGSDRSPYVLTIVLGLLLAVPAANGFADQPKSVTKVDRSDTRKSGGQISKRQVKRVPLTVKTIVRGSSKKAIWAKAVSELPLDKLPNDRREEVAAILKSKSMYRRLPKLRFPTDRRVYEFFNAHPDAAVSIWRVLKISKFKLKQVTASTYKGDCQDGTIGEIEVLYSNSGTQLILCKGTFTSPLLLKPVRAKALIHLQTEFEKNDKGVDEVVHQADLFVEFPSQAVEVAVKFISPISNLIADRNFREISLFVRMMSMAMSTRPNWIEQVVQQMDGVTESNKRQLLRLSAQVYLDARRRKMAELVAPSVEPSRGQNARLELNSPTQKGIIRKIPSRIERPQVDSDQQPR